MGATPHLGLESAILSDCIQEALDKPYRGVFGSPHFGFHETTLDALLKLPHLEEIWFCVESEMNKRRIAVRAAIVAAGIIAIEYFYPFVWISLPISGRVIDRDTHQPIAGAIVASIWRLDGGPVDNNRVDTLAARETTTNLAGEFTISGWGPKFHFSWGSIHSDQPLIAVFKNSYLPYPHEASAHWLPEPFFALHKVLRPVELIHAENRQEYGAAIGGLIREIIDQFPKANSCHWTEIPTMVSTLQRTAQALQSEGIDTHGRFGPVVLEAKPCAQ